MKSALIKSAYYRKKNLSKREARGQATQTYVNLCRCYCTDWISLKWAPDWL